jgi:hypothetical protein
MNRRKCYLSLWLVVITPLAILAGTLAGAADVGPGYDIDMSQMIRVRDGVELEAWIRNWECATIRATYRVYSCPPLPEAHGALIRRRTQESFSGTATYQYAATPVTTVIWATRHEFL